jgi:signal transduction histidine kinase
MDFDKHQRHAIISWVFVCALIALSVTLGILQYRWIGEVSVADRERMRTSLQASLQRLSQEFNAEITAAGTALLPSSVPSDLQGRADAYAARYAHWRESSRHTGMFRRIAMATPDHGALALYILDPNTGIYSPAPWPDSWATARRSVAERFEREGPGFRRPFPNSDGDPALIEIPRVTFNRPEGPTPTFRPGLPPSPGQPILPPIDLDWLLLELDLDYVRASILPELFQRHLGGDANQNWQTEIVSRSDSPQLLYTSDPSSHQRIGANADASVALFEVQYEQIFRRAGIARGRDFWRGPPRPRNGKNAGDPGPPDRGRWLLNVRHRSGSLEAVVNQVRLRNLAVTTGILVLMIGAIVALASFTQRAQRLAQLQMDFVAGVSHELRTPLSVIRTAGHNLGSGVVANPKQVQRYGNLVAGEADRLTAIVEQVLRFAKSKAGQTIGARESVPVQDILDKAVESSAALVAAAHCQLETKISPSLPPLFADPVSLQHAIQNLLSNAAKYGAEGAWISLSASLPPKGDQRFVEIRVADHGAGIPPAELGQIFDPFYRGKWAIENQIHGTGLGLNLVKRIVEAHQGTVTVQSQPGQGTEFLLRLPTAPAEHTDEFADSTSRG